MLFQLGLQLYKYANEMDYKISNLFYAFIFFYYFSISSIHERKQTFA